MQNANSAAANGALPHPETNSATPAPLESASRPEDPASSPTPTVVKTPFLSPSESSGSPPTPVLTADQATKYGSVLSTIEAWATTPPTSPPKGLVFPLTDEERMWLTRECILRYLRAAKWSVSDAITRLLATLAWRREYILDSHTAEYFSPENATGKQVIMGYDIAARPCLYLNPGQQNTPKSEKQIQHLVFSLERLIDLMVPGQETLALLINYREAAKGPSGGQGRQVLKILQSHYPERLGKALIINVPWLFWTFFKLISPFIDPLTREKIAFDENLRLFVPPDQLLIPYGGDVNFEYEHDVYWPALNELAERRKGELIQRWVKGGKRLGELEGYLKGGEVRCLSEVEEEEGKKGNKEGEGEGEGEEKGEEVSGYQSKQVNGVV